MSLKYTYKNKCNVYYVITVLQGSYLKVKKSTLANLKAKAIYWKKKNSLSSSKESKLHHVIDQIVTWLPSTTQGQRAVSPTERQTQAKNGMDKTKEKGQN